MKWFEGIDNLKDLHKKLVRLAKQYHPDLGGDTETMQSINAEYDKMRDMLTNGYIDSDVTLDAEDCVWTSNFDDTEYSWNDGFGDSEFDDTVFKSVLNKIAELKNLIIALRGWRHWFYSDCADYKAILKTTIYRCTVKNRRYYWRRNFARKEQSK